MIIYILACSEQPEQTSGLFTTSLHALQVKHTILRIYSYNLNKKQYVSLSSWIWVDPLKCHGILTEKKKSSSKHGIPSYKLLVGDTTEDHSQTIEIIDIVFGDHQNLIVRL